MNKPFVALVFSLAWVVAASAQYAPATPKAPPGAKAAPGAKKTEQPAKIEGVEIPRGDRGFLGIQIVNGVFKLSFYDAQKKPLAPDVARAALRWDPKNVTGSERALLEIGSDGKSLTSPKNIRPPYHFKLFITLIKEPAETAEAGASENYVVDFRQ